MDLRSGWAWLDWFAPHYTGVDATAGLSTVAQMGLDIKLAFEGLE